MLSKIKNRVSTEFTGNMRAAPLSVKVSDYYNVEFDEAIRDAKDLSPYMQEYRIGLNFTRTGYCLSQKELNELVDTFFALVARDLYGDIIDRLYEIVLVAYNQDMHKCAGLLGQLIGDLERGVTSK